ncbi:hypothetical protein [Rhizobium sp. SL42]|uniref:hypothetical protein n=1 Tax=Rhizobium sp. SL42 TaxID=2806346 RepID=UPI001F3353CC|nr:hypothetical protein [Rhizobium sp. SL42]UJW75939.1 hypothetical protein IM739_05435 [Rhizobium sp. SL42]
MAEQSKILPCPRQLLPLPDFMADGVQLTRLRSGGIDWLHGFSHPEISFFASMATQLWEAGVMNPKEEAVFGEHVEPLFMHLPRYEQWFSSVDPERLLGDSAIRPVFEEIKECPPSIEAWFLTIGALHRAFEWIANVAGKYGLGDDAADMLAARRRYIAEVAAMNERRKVKA